MCIRISADSSWRTGLWLRIYALASPTIERVLAIGVGSSLVEHLAASNPFQSRLRSIGASITAAMDCPFSNTSIDSTENSSIPKYTTRHAEFNPDLHIYPHVCRRRRFHHAAEEECLHCIAVLETYTRSSTPTHAGTDAGTDAAADIDACADCCAVANAHLPAATQRQRTLHCECNALA